MSCELRTILFNNQTARAQIVRLNHSWQQIIKNHNYPKAIENMLGELVAVSVVLSASLKFKGSLILQIKGDGPVSLMTAECTHELNVRATAVFDKTKHIQENSSFQELVNEKGRGRFVIILDPQNRLPGQHPYQGIIELSGQSIAQAIENYMQQSEQLKTRLWLQSDHESTGALLLQQMPNEGGKLDSATTVETHETQAQWNHLTLLCNTLKPKELLENSPETIARHLFWQEPNQTLSIRPAHFFCTCSREKVAKILKGLGKEEIEDALKTQKSLSINCDYCNTTYAFDSIDCAALFSD